MRGGARDEGRGEEKKKKTKHDIETHTPGFLSIYNRRVRSEITTVEALTVSRVSRARIRLIGVARAACK